MIRLEDSRTWPFSPWLPLRRYGCCSRVPELGVLHADHGAVVFLINLFEGGDTIRNEADLLVQRSVRYATMAELQLAWEVD